MATLIMIIRPTNRQIKYVYVCKVEPGEMFLPLGRMRPAPTPFCTMPAGSFPRMYGRRAGHARRRRGFVLGIPSSFTKTHRRLASACTSMERCRRCHHGTRSVSPHRRSACCLHPTSCTEPSRRGMAGTTTEQTASPPSPAKRSSRPMASVLQRPSDEVSLADASGQPS